MPYITEKAKKQLAAGREPRNVGELNYCITRLILEYCHQNINYSDINDVIGVLECAKIEFYRRVVIPYEDKKIVENGDVYNQLFEGKK